MRKPVSKKRQIEFILPVMIFFVFTLSALIVILFAARVYQRTVADAAMNYNANTSLSYIREKIHQHDHGNVGITNFDGCEAIVMKDTLNNEIYATYIYAAKGALWELFIKDGTEGSFTATSGQKILDIKSFKVSPIGKRLLSFSCTDENGQTATACVGIYAGDLSITRHRQNNKRLSETAPQASSIIIQRQQDTQDQKTKEAAP